MAELDAGVQPVASAAPPRPPRHRWSEPDRADEHATRRACLRRGCGLVRVTRHEPDGHWVEWWREGMQLRPGKTPICRGVEALSK